MEVMKTLNENLETWYESRQKKDMSYMSVLKPMETFDTKTYWD